MWEGDCQVVCVNNREIIGQCSLGASPQWSRGQPGMGGRAMALALHTIRPTRGSTGVVGEVPVLSSIGGMPLCPRLSPGKAQVTGEGPELGPCLEIKASCECHSDLKGRLTLQITEDERSMGRLMVDCGR